MVAKSDFKTLNPVSNFEIQFGNHGRLPMVLKIHFTLMRLIP